MFMSSFAYLQDKKKLKQWHIPSNTETDTVALRKEKKNQKLTSLEGQLSATQIYIRPLPLLPPENRYSHISVCEVLTYDMSKSNIFFLTSFASSFGQRQVMRRTKREKKVNFLFLFIVMVSIKMSRTLKMDERHFITGIIYLWRHQEEHRT